MYFSMVSFFVSILGKLHPKARMNFSHLIEGQLSSTIDHIGIPIELGAIICVFLMEYSNNAEGVFQWTILKRNLSCK